MTARPTVKPTTIDEYLAAVEPAKRKALERLRRNVLSAAPNATECVAYRLPAFRLDGKLLVIFGAAAKHCALYPMSRRVVAAHKDELRGFDFSEGTIRFQPDRHLSAALVRTLVKARIAENAARQQQRAATAARRRSRSRARTGVRA
jgi:uncharacterized protein YdhG (YjbR/CyaY superfamily)